MNQKFELTPDESEKPVKSVAIILAAGSGGRLRPLTNTIPKCLIEIGTHPIVFHQVSSLKHFDIRNVILVVGFMTNKVREYVDRVFPDLNITFIENPLFERTNTLYSLALAAQTLEPETEVFQLNGDVVFDPRIIDLLKSSDADKSYVTAEPKRCGEEEIKILLAADGAIAELNKKIPPERAIGEAIGINKFSSRFFRELKKVLESLKDNYPMEYFEYAIEHAIKSGAKIYPLDIKELKAVEIDFFEDLERARNEVLSFLS